MVKSPGKWIKAILFGRKASISSSSMAKNLSRSASERPAQVSSKESIPTSILDTPLLSDLVPGTVIERIDNSSFEKGEASILAGERLVSSLSKKDGDEPSYIGLSKSSEKTTLVQATIVLQAHFRGYQARRRFQTLKSVVRLQAAIRGRLVRRQAVATLFCVLGIVRFQAITRGYLVRKARIRNGQFRKQSFDLKDAKNQDSCVKYSPARALSKNAFIDKLLASLRTTMPLRLPCGPRDSNSAWSWLHRWSTSRVWVPYSEQKATGRSRVQTVERELIKPKRNTRRVPSAAIQNDPNHANAETEKLKVISRKFSSQSLKSAPVHQEFDNGKIKRGLTKNQKPIDELSNVEIDVKQPKGLQRKLSKSPSSAIGKSMEDLVEPGTKSKNRDVLVEMDFLDDQINSDNYKSIQTTSLPAKSNDHGATPGSVTRAPSYMATTASSQAKVKSQVSPKFGQDVIQENGLARRFYLPSSMNGKLISSPRVRRLVQCNGKGGSKIDRSLSSREITDKVNHVDWKW